MNPSLAEITEHLRAETGGAFRALFAIGSLAHGGYDPLVSDIDLALVLGAPAPGGSAAEAERLRASCVRHGLPLAERVSLFVATEEELASGRLAGTRFTPIDALDFALHGRPLAGDASARERVRRPGRDELLAGTAEFAFARILRKHFPASFSAPAELYARDFTSFTKFLLFPARFLHTLAEARPASNEEAVARYVASPGTPAASARLVASALAWRRAAPSAADAGEVTHAAVKALYEEFLAAYAGALRSTGADALAAEAEQWRKKIADL